jgi:hypothetical protein
MVVADVLRASRTQAETTPFQSGAESGPSLTLLSWAQCQVSWMLYIRWDPFHVSGTRVGEIEQAGVVR